ncbi:MAG: metal-dependent transcriptional regulator [Thermaerobacter sp.]|nr:metal-dependent transcriptional regulator [Thermaerobacter sp.]
MVDSMAKNAPLSRSREDYLAHIYRIQAVGHNVNTGEVAQHLGVTPASTSAMFKRLAQEGLVNYKSYSGVSLTEEGERAASHVVRRHRVIERFLTDILGIGWERVDEFANRMEHAMPDEVLEAIERLLGGPDTCPHGYPIPSEEGKLAVATGQPVEALVAGEWAVIRHVDESDTELLRHLRERGLVPGTLLQVAETNLIDGTRTLRIGDSTLVVGQRIARALFVDRVVDDA